MKKVTAIVLHHLNQNQGYLDLCLDAMSKQEGVDLEVLVMASCPEVPEFKDFKGLKVTMIPNNYSTAKATNEGAKIARPDSEYLWLCNDDIIPAKSAARIMAQTVSVEPVILNPVCPTENGFYFRWNLEIGGKIMPRFNTLEDVSSEMVDDILEAQMPSIQFPIPFNCFHATMMRRDLFDKVGGIDERYRNQQEDKDFCWTAMKHHNASCWITTGAFVFHFGGVSAKYTITDAMREQGVQTLNEKWGNA